MAQDPTVGLCLGPYGGPREGGCFCDERGIPVTLVYDWRLTIHATLRRAESHLPVYRGEREGGSQGGKQWEEVREGSSECESCDGESH